MIKKQLSILLCSILLVAFPLATAASTLDEVKSYVKDYYVGDIKGDLSKSSSINEALELLDPYSTYFTKKEFDQFLNSVDMTTVGIGIVIEQQDTGIVITQIIDGGSAQTAGLKVGDTITAINGTTAVGLNSTKAVNLITGQENTPVTLTLVTVNGASVTKTLTRKKFAIPNVSQSLLYGNIGYIALSSFSNDAAKLVANAVTTLKSKGATKFILDLQNNGGGYVTSAEQLIGMFPNATNAYSLKETSGTTLAKALPQAVKFPSNTKVLVNKQSASSSEMTAAALLDQKAATLYGQQTYGKGSMQSFFELSDGSYLKLTVGHFLGPANTIINTVGLKPNVVTTGNPLAQAHFDTITENYTNYSEKKNLLNVPTTKFFTINFNNDLAGATIQNNAVELVQLGGDKVDISIKQVNKQLIITPVKPLVAGQQYALLIHPGIKSADNMLLKNGYYLYITVASN